MVQRRHEHVLLGPEAEEARAEERAAREIEGPARLDADLAPHGELALEGGKAEIGEREGNAAPSWITATGWPSIDEKVVRSVSCRRTISSSARWRRPRRGGLRGAAPRGARRRRSRARAARGTRGAPGQTRAGAADRGDGGDRRSLIAVRHPRGFEEEAPDLFFAGLELVREIRRERAARGAELDRVSLEPELHAQAAELKEELDLAHSSPSSISISLPSASGAEAASRRLAGRAQRTAWIIAARPPSVRAWKMPASGISTASASATRATTCVARRVAAEIEEVVGDADALAAQHLLPDLRQRGLDRVARGHVDRLVDRARLEGRQGAAIDLAVGRERHRGEDHVRVRAHVGRELLAEEGAQIGLIQRGILAHDQVGDEALVAGTSSRATATASATAGCCASAASISPSSIR